MKRLLSFISALLILGASAAFADVSVKKLDDGKIEVTFFYGNPRAQEVLLAGDFTDWQNGAVPMEKGEKGFSYTKIVAPGTVMKYKFISDGNWTEDLREPDKCDDGFGGHNGLVDVDALTASAGSGAPAKKAGLKFATWSMLGAQAKWGDGTEANKNELQTAGLNLTSYMKASGDALPGMPVYFEIAVAEQKGFDNIYNKGTTGWGAGFMNLLVDTIFDPVYYFGGQAEKKTYLGHFKVGFDTPIVNYTTGYKYAKLPPHTNVNWTTIDKEWEAGYSEVGGFSQFDFTPALNLLLGNLGVESQLVVGPNRAADRAGNRYGLYAYANAKFFTGSFSHYVDVQYNGAYGTKYNELFKEIMEMDIIGGYQGNYGPVTVKANYLYNGYGSNANADGTKSYFTPASSDVGTTDDCAPMIDNMAANVSVTFSNDLLTGNLGFRMRGAQAGMMYVEDGPDDHTNISDQLGKLNHMRVFGDFNIWAYYGVNVGIAPYFQMALRKESAKTVTTDVGLRPYFTIDLNELANANAKITGYAQTYLCFTKDAKFENGDKTFSLDQAALTYEQKFDNDYFKGFKSVAVFDNRSADGSLISLTNDFDVIANITAQAGLGLRLAKEGKADPLSPFGFYVGAKTKIPVLYKPTAYVQYMYGMDPYNEFNDGPTAYRLDSGDLTFKDGYGDYNGNAAVRVGLQWDL